MECAKDIEKLRKRSTEDIIYIFLADLDHNLDQVNARILDASPLPSLKEAYSQVHREEQRQFTMGIEDRLEASTLIVQKNNSKLTPPNSSSNPFSRLCTHCNKKKIKY